MPKKIRRNRRSITPPMSQTSSSGYETDSDSSTATPKVSPKTARRKRAARHSSRREEISAAAFRQEKQLQKERAEIRREAESRLRKKYGTPSGAAYSKACRLMSDGRKIVIKLCKITRTTKNIFREYITARREGAMISPMYFYYQSRNPDREIKYFVLSSGQGDVEICELLAKVHNQEAVFQQKGSSGPKYSYLFPKLDNIVLRKVFDGMTAEDARDRIGRDLRRIATGRDIKGEYIAEDYNILVTTGVILGVDMARAPKARKYIAEFCKDTTRTFAEKIKMYAGFGAGHFEIEHRGKSHKFRSGVRGLRMVGELHGDAGDMSDHSDEELAPRVLFDLSDGNTRMSSSSDSDIFSSQDSG